MTYLCTQRIVGALDKAPGEIVTEEELQGIDIGRLVDIGAMSPIDEAAASEAGESNGEDGDLDHLKKAELVELCAARDIPTKGLTCAGLIEALKADAESKLEQSERESSSDAESETDLSEFTDEELVAKAAELEISTEGMDRDGIVAAIETARAAAAQ